MSGNDKHKLTEIFAKPAEFKGTEAEYNTFISKLADNFRYGVDGDANRGFLRGGLYYPAKVEDVKRAVELKFGR